MSAPNDWKQRTMREATSVIGEKVTGVTVNEDHIVLHFAQVSLRFYPTNEETVEAERIRDVRRPRPEL